MKNNRIGYVGCVGLLVCCIAIATVSISILCVAEGICMIPIVYKISKLWKVNIKPLLWKVCLCVQG